MSEPRNPHVTAVAVFQANFGTPPGSQDAKSECEKWQRLCDQLIADREQLRTELEKARLDRFCRDFQPQTMEEVYALVDRETTIEEIIRDLEQTAEKGS